MGITCRIVRDSNGNIDYIESNDGQKSILFDNLRSLYGTEKALEYYALTESENFKDVQEVTKEDFTFSGQDTLNKLEETGLADNVYQMTSEEIEAKLIELGVEADVAKQVSQPGGYYSNANSAFSNLKDKNVKNVQGWMKALTDVQKNGGIKNVNQELEWIGLEDYLNSYVKENNPKAGNISSSVVEDYIKSNQIEIVDVSKKQFRRSNAEIDSILNNYKPEGTTPMRYYGSKEKYGYKIASTGEFIEVKDSNLISLMNELREDKFEESNTKYSGYQLKGAENYREVLLTMPNNSLLKYKESLTKKYGEGYKGSQLTDEEIDKLQDLKQQEIKGSYKSSHWDEANILAHVRLNEKTLPDGRRVLIVNEIQSDWAQEGRKKGFAGSLTRDNITKWEIIRDYGDSKQISFSINGEEDGIVWRPAEETEEQLKQRMVNTYNNMSEGLLPIRMPYKNTDQWVGLVTRKVMQMASQEGYDGIAFATGQQSADMYSLSQQVDKININPQGDIKVVYISMKNNADDTVFINQEGVITESASGIYNGKQAEEVLGKDLTRKILETTEETTLEGEGLEFGGEGMKTFYDKIVPKVVQKEAQRFDKNIKLETVDFSEYETVNIYTLKDIKEVKLNGRSLQRYIRNAEGTEQVTIDNLQLAIIEDMFDLLSRNGFESIEEARNAATENDEDGLAVVRIYDQALKDHDILAKQEIEDLQIEYYETAKGAKDKLSLGAQPYLTLTQSIKDSVSQGIPQFQKAGIDKITNGFVVGKDVYLNKDTATESTQIHEFNHLYQKQLKNERPEVYKKGLNLIKAELTKNNSEIKDVIDFVKTSQPDLEGEKLFEEILTELVGRKGLELLVKEKNKAKSSGIIDWLSEVWKEIKSMLGISSMSDEEVLKLNLEDFTKASATDLLSGSKLSKKETVKVEKNEVNGKLVYEPFFKGKKMGALRLLPYNGGYRVDSVVVYDKFQKKGVARNLYKYAINDLSKQGISLSSLNIRAPYAEKIWEGLVNEGIATKEGNDYRAFREPKVSEVLEYANETEEPLTKEQSVQAIDTLASFGINNSLELFEKLKEAFVKDGAIVFNRKKLEKSGYNSYEITSILTNRDLQQQIKENIYKVKNTDLSIDLEGLEVLKTDEVNIFGKQTVYVKSEREAVNEIVDGEIKSKKTDTLQTLNKTYPKTLPEIDTRPFETILKVTENVAKNNPEKLKKVAQAMQEEALKYGVDLRGIENKIYPIQRLKSFTESLVNYISEPNNNFSEVYDKFFEVSQLPKVKNGGNDIKLDTELSEYELFRDHNLVRKEGNTYTKVSPENIEDLYNYFLRQQESKVQELSKIDELYDKASKINDFETFVDSVGDFRDAHSAPSKDTTPTEEKLVTGGDFSLEEVAKGFHNQPDDYFEPKNGARYYGYNNSEGMQSFTAISNVIRSIKAGNDNIKITSYRAVPNGVDINELKDYDWVSFSEDYTKNHGESRFGEGEYKIIQQEVDIRDLWWDGNDINEWGYDTGNTKKYSRRELKSIFDNSRKLTKEDIQARIPELEVEDYQTDSDVLEALFIWKNFLGYPIKTKSNRKAPFKGMTNNPFKVVTADGIVLKNNDTLTRAKADLYEEEVVKQDVDYQDEVREKVSLGEIIPEKIKTDYTIIEDGVLMTKNNTNQFLRTPLANYELIYQDGNLSFYKDVLGAEKNLSDIDFTKYLNESVKPDNYIVAKNSYSKQELEEINNKYFSCK